jgi:hypothetical protein
MCFSDRCRNVHLSDLKLRDRAFWNVHSAAAATS